MAHRWQILARPDAAPDQLVVQHELSGTHEKMHHRVVRHLLGAERGGICQDDPVGSRCVKIQMIVAVAERHQTLAAAVQAHVRESRLIKPVALRHRSVDVAQRFDQVRDAAAFVTHERPARDTDGAALLLERGCVEGLRLSGTDVKNSDGLRHDVAPFAIIEFGKSKIKGSDCSQ